MKQGLWITIWLCALIGQASTADAQPGSKALADSAILVVAALREIRSLENRLAPQERISLQVRDTPNSKKRFYWVQVSISAPLRITPVYNFAVYPTHMSVGYINTTYDTVVSLDVWRKKTDTPRQHQ